MRFPLDVQKVIGYDYGVKTSYNDHHLGVDWKADFVPIYAPKSGTIVNLLDGPEGGLTIWFKPDGENTIIRWLHLKKFMVNQGQHVVEGYQVAVTGNTGTDGNGHHPLSHLHEDIWPKGKVTLNFKDTSNPHDYYKINSKPMLEIVNDNGTYYVVGNKAKLGINGEDALAFWRQLTDKERIGSTTGIPSIGIWEKTFGVDLD